MPAAGFPLTVTLPEMDAVESFFGVWACARTQSEAKTNTTFNVTVGSGIKHPRVQRERGHNTRKRFCCRLIGFGSILHELKLQPHAHAGTVVEAAKLRARDIVLHVARIEMVGDVEEGNARTAVIFLALERNRQALHDQHVECENMRVAASAVSSAYKILLLIQG